ncbi:hypothetical protein GTA09_21105 [Rhodococcus hoagii]|nr:hypothetical protein [Prescottella equi]
MRAYVPFDRGRLQESAQLADHRIVKFEDGVSSDITAPLSEAQGVPVGSRRQVGFDPAQQDADVVEGAAAHTLLVLKLAFEVFYSHPKFVLVVPDCVDLGVQASVLARCSP